MTIDAYLAELRRLLPRLARLRALGEIREHLRDTAARHRAAGASPGDAEGLATTEFGDVELVAARFGRELAVRGTRIAATLSLVSVAFFVFPFYVVPESTLPPAPWDEKPYELVVLQRATLALWIATAVVLATVSVVLACSRWRRFASGALAATAAAMLGATALSVALLWRWTAHAPSTPNLALANTLALPILVACVGATWWALASRRRLAPAD